MTREEAKVDIYTIDDIFDYFESRTCNNCRYHEDIGKSYKMCELLAISTNYDFGCVAFEPKKNKDIK